MSSSSFWEQQSVLVTGGGGFLGSHVVAQLKKRGIQESQLVIPRKKNYDLREREVCRDLVKGKTMVLHLAGNVGGIGYNDAHVAEMFFDNLVMGTELMEAAYRAGVQKFVTLGTICSYPKNTPTPFREDYLWQGYPEEITGPYGLVKKMLLVQAQAYRTQYGFKGIFLMPVNLYGPDDNFNPSSSHVIPALIKTVYEAKKTNAPFITAWGTGKPTREFLYVEDAARAIVLALLYYDKPEPVNLGSGREISIKDLLTLIAKIMDYKGKVRWDILKPDGQPRRRLNVSRAKKEFGFSAKISFEEGVKKTINWYQQHATI